MSLLNEVIGFFGLIFMAILAISGVVALIVLGAMLPLLLPVGLLLMVPCAMLFNLSTWFMEKTK